MGDFRKSGPYTLSNRVLVATMPSGIFLKLVGQDEDGKPQVEVYVHPDLVKIISGDPRHCGEEI